MRRWGTLAMVLALVGGATGCADADDRSWRPPLPDTVVIEGESPLPDPFGAVGIESRALPGDAALIGADYAVTLGRYGVTTELTGEAIRKLDLRGERTDPPWLVGAGREFLLLHLTGSAPNGPTTADRPPTAVVLVENQARKLSRTALRPNSIVIVSVPTGADATLAVTEAGQTQSISIRTGRLVGPSPQPEPSKPPAPPSDPPVVAGKVGVRDYVAVPGHGPGLGWDAIIDVEIEVALRSYDATRGPAKDGTLWAHVEVSLSGNPTRVTFQVDLARSLTIRVPGGQALRIPAGTTMRTPNFLVTPGAALSPTTTVPDTWSTVLPVPERTRKLSVTYRTRGSAVDSDGDRTTFTRRDLRNSATLVVK